MLLFKRNEMDSVARIFLLTRVSFNPFGATALEFTMTGHARASILVEQEVAPLHQLKPLLYILAQGTYSEEYELYTCKYATASTQPASLASISLNWASLKHVSAMEPAAREGGDEGHDDNDNAFDKIFQSKHKMLQAALGNRAVTKPKQQPRNQSRQAKPGPRPKRAAEQGQEKKGSRDEEQPGKSREAHESLMIEWEGALHAQLGPLPTSSASASASSSSSAKRTITGARKGTAKGTEETGIPIASYTLPWRDEEGYCWTFNEASGKAYPLGLALNRLKLTRCVS